MIPLAPNTGKRITERSERLQGHVAMYDRALIRGNLEAMFRELVIIREEATGLLEQIDPIVHLAP